MRESELSRAVRDYLQYEENLGNLYFDRLQAGSLLAKYGDRFNKVTLCKPGTADYFVLKWEEPDWAPTKGWTRVIFLELKGKGGKQTDDQKDFAEAVGRQGGEYYIVRSVDDVMEVL